MHPLMYILAQVYHHVWMISHWTSSSEEGECYVVTSIAETGGERRKTKEK